VIFPYLHRRSQHWQILVTFCSFSNIFIVALFDIFQADDVIWPPDNPATLAAEAAAGTEAVLPSRGRALSSFLCQRPGPNPTKRRFSQFYTYLYDFLTNMCKISCKFVKNESYQIFTNICKPDLAYFTSILQKIGSKLF
jgi:hypothetical protein